MGLIRAFVYLALRRALFRNAVRRTLTFAVIAVALGTLPVVGGNRDDFRIIPIGPSLVCFSLVLAMYGAAIAALVDVFAEGAGIGRRREHRSCVTCVAYFLYRNFYFFLSSCLRESQTVLY